MEQLGADGHGGDARFQVHAQRQDLAGARAAFDRALAVAPDLLPALSGRAGVAHELSDFHAAVNDLSTAVALAPDDPGLHYNLAIAYQSAHQWPDALSHLDAAAALAPDDPDVNEALQGTRNFAHSAGGNS